MKTMMKIIAAMLIAVMLMSTAALAAGKTLVATRDDANIRKGPGTSYAVIAKTVRGKTATYLGEKVVHHGRTWLKVGSHGKVGWICSDYVKAR